MHGIVHKFYYRDVLFRAVHAICLDFRCKSAAGFVFVGVS